MKTYTAFIFFPIFMTMMRTDIEYNRKFLVLVSALQIYCCRARVVTASLWPITTSARSTDPIVFINFQQGELFCASHYGDCFEEGTWNEQARKNRIIKKIFFSYDQDWLGIDLPSSVK